MQGSLEHPPVVIRQSRLRLGLLGAIAAAFTLYTAWNLMSVGTHDIVYLGFDFGRIGTLAVYATGFVLCALGGGFVIMAFIIPDTLTLAPEGLTWSGMTRVMRLQWEDVSFFETNHATAGRRTHLVFYNLSDQYMIAHRNKTRDYGALGSNWELPPDRLVELLNAAKAHWDAPVRAADAPPRRAAGGWRF